MKTHACAMAVDTVIFDLGGVLIDWNPRYLFRELIDSEQALEWFLAEVCSPDWNAQQDAGRRWADGVAELVARYPQQRALIEAYWLQWERTLGDAIEPTVELLAQLRQRGVRLLALTNWSAETFPVAWRRFPFLAWFEGIVVSGEEGLAKPDPAIFDCLLQRYRVRPPGRALFIDDVAGNVQAAHGAGLQAVLFKEADGLRRDLEAHGLLAS